MKLEYSDEWLNWIHPKSFTTLALPVKLSTEDSWMVFKPDSNDYILVPNDEFDKHYVSKLKTRYNKV